jgi:hypothetical protein
MIQWSLLLIALLFAETTGSPSNPAEKKEKLEMSERLTQLHTEIEKLNLDLRCLKTSDCEALAIGNRLCGGPQAYLVVSKKNKSIKTLKEKAALHTKISQEYNQKYRGDMMGICSVAVKPLMSCAKNKCVALQETEP